LHGADAFDRALQEASYLTGEYERGARSLEMLGITPRYAWPRATTRPEVGVARVTFWRP
jgi:hypothetical protein